MSVTNHVPVRTERLIADLETLARFGFREKGKGIDRPVYSANYRYAVDWLSELMREAGLFVRMDAAGNLIGRLGPAEGPAVVCGSHIDTVPGGGKYDGALGVLAGLEVARCLSESQMGLGKAFEVIAFADEEGAYLSELGARAMIGQLSFDELKACHSRNGTPVIDAMERFGLDGQRISEAARPREDISAYVELHIEQGPVLESEGVDIGIVESIVGLHRSEIIFTGQANHAGTTPVRYRRDAFRAAAETIAESFAKLERDFPPDLRLTYGAAEVFPGASNVVPARVLLTQEIRADGEYAIDTVFDMTRKVSEEVSQLHGVKVDFRLVSKDAPAKMSERIIKRISNACSALSYTSHRMLSGAGHDAQVMAKICDAGMIFVPSANGISHSPAEHTSIRHIGLGASVLFETLRSILQSTGSQQRHG